MASILTSRFVKSAGGLFFAIECAKIEILVCYLDTRFPSMTAWVNAKVTRYPPSYQPPLSLRRAVNVWKVQCGKLTKKIAGGVVVSYRGLYFVIKAAGVIVLAIASNLDLPLFCRSIPGNTLIFGAPFGFLLVVAIFAAGAYPKILAAIVQPIPVYVVALLAVTFVKAQNLTVHEEILTTKDSSLSVSIIKIPPVPAQPFIVLIINQRESSTVCKLNLFHLISKIKTPLTLARRWYLGNAESQRDSLKLYDYSAIKTKRPTLYHAA